MIGATLGMVGLAAAAEAGRRAVVTLALSCAPNGYVTQMEPGYLVLHQLNPMPPHPDTVWSRWPVRANERRDARLPWIDAAA